MPSGSFIPFRLPYFENGAPVPAAAQAERILQQAGELIAKGAAGVGITYSANYGQTRKIAGTYASGGWNTRTGGANQAEVMQNMEALLETPFIALRGKVHILPITTMNAYTDPLDPWNENVHMRIVSADLDRIQAYLDRGWDVLGWQNQQTVNDPAHPFAVGGGVAQLPTAVSDKIQQTLIGFAQRYPNQHSS